MVHVRGNGTIHKTEKAKLLLKLESKIDSSGPLLDDISARVVDAMFTVNPLMNLPATHGGLASA